MPERPLSLVILPCFYRQIPVISTFLWWQRKVAKETSPAPLDSQTGAFTWRGKNSLTDRRILMEACSQTVQASNELLCRRSDSFPLSPRKTACQGRSAMGQKFSAASFS